MRWKITWRPIQSDHVGRTFEITLNQATTRSQSKGESAKSDSNGKTASPREQIHADESRPKEAMETKLGVSLDFVLGGLRGQNNVNDEALWWRPSSWDLIYIVTPDEKSKAQKQWTSGPLRVSCTSNSFASFDVQVQVDYKFVERRYRIIFTPHVGSWRSVTSWTGSKSWWQVLTWGCCTTRVCTRQAGCI